MRSCLELLKRTNREIAEHIKEVLVECIKQDTLTGEDAVLGFVRLECSNCGKSFSLRLSFICLLLKPSLIFYKKLLGFN